MTEKRKPKQTPEIYFRTLENLIRTELNEFRKILLRYHQIIFDHSYQTAGGNHWRTYQILIETNPLDDSELSDKLVGTITMLNGETVEGTIKFVPKNHKL